MARPSPKSVAKPVSKNPSKSRATSRAKPAKPAAKKSARKPAPVRAMETFLQETLVPSLRFEQEEFVERQRMARVVARTRERVARKVYPALGIDPEHLEALHQREQKSLEGRAERRAEQVHAFAAGRARRAAKQLAEMAERYETRQGEQGNREIVFLPSAAHITSQSIGPVIGDGEPILAWANLHVERGSPGRNAVRGWGNINAGRGASGSLGLLMHHHFVWTSTRDGMLQATALLYADLTYRLGTVHSCRLYERSARVALKGWLSVGQQGSGQAPFDATTKPMAWQFEEAVTASGFNDPTVGPVVGSPLVSEFVSGPPLPLPIRAGAPVVCTVSLSLSMSAVEGFVNLDFDDPLEIGVPFAWFRIE